MFCTDDTTAPQAGGFGGHGGDLLWNRRWWGEPVHPHQAERQWSSVGTVANIRSSACFKRA